MSSRTNGNRSAPEPATPCKGMNTSAPRIPKMGRHSSGQARVTLNGKVHYLGPYGSPEAHARYAELVREWLDNHRRPLVVVPHAQQALLTVKDLFRQYREWIVATGRYTKNGRPTTQRGLLENAWAGFEGVVGNLRVTGLSESVMLRWRDRLEQNSKLTRMGINRKVTLVLSVLKWGRSRGLVTREVWADASAIEPLKRGECGARPDHGRERRAVTLAEVEAVAAVCAPVVGAMLRVQAMLGCRPGEVLGMRWKDIDKTPVVVGETVLWTYRVPADTGKTSHHGRSISYPIPPAAQAILEGFQAPPAALAFGAMPGRTYRQAVKDACRKADVKHFSPHEVRHGSITRAAEAFGVLAAQRLANHSSASTTARYLHTDDQSAYKVAASIG